MTIYKYRFDFRIDDKYPHYKEEDGLTVTAPSEGDAWKTFGGISGRFGRPNSENYDIVQLEAVYEFDGDVEEWREADRLGETPEVV